MDNPDIKILNTLESDPNFALKLLYDTYYSYICNVIYKMIGDQMQAEDIAQDVFIEVWKRKESLDIFTTLRGYLRKTAVNKTLNFIRSQKMSFDTEDTLVGVANEEYSSQQKLEADDLKEKINYAVKLLPEKCRIVFGLSRYEQLSYKEIAEKLDISIKTVENQISKALKIMRHSIFVEN